MPLFTKSKTAAEVAGPPAVSSREKPQDQALERHIHEVGASFLEDTQRHRSGVLSTAFWSQKLIDWAMKDEAFKVQLFRFVDAFPMLRTPQQIHDHLADYLAQPGVTPPPGMGLGLKAGGLLKGTFAKTVSGQITSMAERFIAGTDAMSALPMLEKLWSKGIGFSVDLLGEACVSNAEADVYQKKYLDLVTTLPRHTANWPANERLENDHLGAVPRTNVSIKISSLFARTDPVDFEGSIAGLMDALRPVLEAARDNNVLINFDMEFFAYKDLTLELFMRCCEAVDFTAGIAMQAYLRSGDDDARRIIEWSKRTGRVVSVRLVKGAYWDFETIHAEQMGWPVPVWSRKPETDASFERMSAAFIDAIPREPGEGGVNLAFGSHNLRSIAAGLARLERRELPPAALDLQFLHGMADEIKAAAVERGLRVREYVPVGEMIPGMAYLVRRLLENTSNESWLLASSVGEVDTEALLASPHRSYDNDPGVERITGAPERHQLSAAVPGVGDGRPFFTESHHDFADPKQRAAFAAAIRTAVVPSVPNDATPEDADEALGRAVEAGREWRDAAPRTRSGALVAAAAIMRRRRDELSGIEIREAGKTWREADADVCEAIDFCEYYARVAVNLFEPNRLGSFIGELDEVFYQPRGVAVIVSPWNFPLAICCGMTTAALVAGNATLVKPSRQTPGIARVMCEILWEAGVPRDALHLMAGPGSTMGAFMIRDPRVGVIAFTGSKEVGLDIIQAAGTTPPGQTHVKKVIAEMGGKNAVIVDASADLDEAVIGVRDSAFGYCGQKCSACSRVVVVDTAYDQFLSRLVESTKTLVIGDPMEPGSDMGPVIDESAARTIREYIEIGKQEGRQETDIQVPPGLEEKIGKPYIAPHIFSGIETRHRLFNEEIFGPVLSVIRVKDFDEAIDVANAAEYKLTGGVFSRKPAHLEQARREFRVGNLYLNRGITGALVGRQPFGGFGMSGVGSKAGGEDYLHQFVEPRSVTENTMRRGFAPGL
ncbi:MAG: proline dehydrogenase family protein [Planctomycetota bacterium]|jgi:RHH-type proline utilization regulon transcriptional repressor/proline dehydrogenase/delta 1-pyrroline-5-carboxylate dehydrogenase